MRILIVDYILMHGLPLAQRCALDGHEVIYASCWGPKSDSPYMGVLGHGIKNVTVDPEGWMKWIGKVDVATVTGSEHKGHIPNFLRKNGVPVAGPGSWGVRLELDREYGRKILGEMGLNPAPSKTFTKVADLIKHVEKNPGRYILKLDQTAREFSETVVGRDPEGRDILDVAKRLESKLAFAEGFVKLYLDSVLEGTEVGMGGFFNGERFLDGGPYVTFEEDVGYAYDLRIPADKLVSDLDKVSSVLRQHKFKGSIDINGFLTKEGWRAIEFTPRWGDGTTEFFCHAAPDMGKLLHAVATGGDAPAIRKDIKGRLGVLVNAQADEGLSTPVAMNLPDPDASSPVVRSGSSSFWTIWPARTKDGWVNLPVHGQREKRVGSYVAVADSLDKAFKDIDELSGKASVASVRTEIGRSREDLSSKINKIYRYARNYEWIDNLAEDTDHIYGPIKRKVRSRS